MRWYKASRKGLVVGAAVVTSAVVTTGALSMTGGLQQVARTAAQPFRAAPAATPAKRLVRPARPVMRAHPAARPAAAGRAERSHGRTGAARPAAAARKHTARIATATVSFALCAKAGTATLAGGVSVPIWGYALKPAGVLCSDSSVVPALPGPQLVVAKDTVVAITVTNALARPTSLEVPQYGVDQGSVVVAPGASLTYTFTASRPGTSLYASEADGGRQQAMGLYGAIVVRPAAGIGQAYEDPSTSFASERVLVLSEVDPALNASADPSTFDMEQWAPSYWLINGKSYPDTPAIPAAHGSKLLLRYVNAGLDNHTMTMLGMHATLVGRDGFALAHPFDVVAETIASGQTVDEIATVPATVGAHLPLYNRQLHLSNGALGAPAHDDGGALTFVDVT